MTNLLHLFTDRQYFLFSILERLIAFGLMLSILPAMVREARVRDSLRLVRLSLLTIGFAYTFVVVATGSYTWCLTQPCYPWFTDWRGEVAGLNGLGMLLAAVA